MTPAFPTAAHEDVANIVVSFFERLDGVRAIVVMASCARGVAVAESDLDMFVLTDPAVRADVERRWMDERPTDVGIVLHLDVIDGRYEPTRWDDGGGPDGFELELGNHLAYSAPVWTKGSAFDDLREKWLPYYDESLQRDRLAMVREACVRDLDSIPLSVRRELYFQAFDRLYKAFREFLQALFIARRTYPIAYDKWIRYQLCELLSAPELHAQLPSVLEISKLESDAIVGNADRLRALVENEIADQ